MNEAYRYLTVRCVGGLLDAYEQNGVQVVPELDNTNLVVVSKHTEHYKAVVSVEHNWRSVCTRFSEIAQSMPFFIVEVAPETSVKVGEVIAAETVKMNRPRF